MYGAWLFIAGWGGTSGQLVIASAEIAFAAVVGGWIVGRRLGRSVPARLGALVAYVFVARLVLVPINVVGSTWEDLRAGRISDLVGIVGAAGGYVLYGAVSAIYTTAYLLPVGAGWLVTVLILRRTFAP